MINIQTFTFNFVSVNTFVVYDETREAVIIDCGCLEEAEEQALADFITDRQLTVRHLLNTHLHLDHAFGNAFASRIFGIKPEGNKLEEDNLPNLETQAARFGMQLPLPSVTLGTYLNEGDKITFGNTHLLCLLVPGHSPGSLAFYSPDGACVFSGDALFQGSIGRTDLWGGNFNTLISAIRSKLLTLPEKTVVYPGHGPTTTIGEEKKYNMYLR